ncbi:MAG: hypothetical protein WCP69_12755 [Bacteroidota bacterium]
MASVKIENEVSIEYPNKWSLFFQWCKYIYDDKSTDYGYRFIWRRPDGSLQAARGQARIPSAKELNELIALATNAGWFSVVENQINDLSN